MRVIVQRAFLIEGVRQEPGSELDVADAFARALMHNGQAVAAQAAPPVGPMTTDSTPALVPGKPTKGKTHARKSGTS